MNYLNRRLTATPLRHLILESAKCKPLTVEKNMRHEKNLDIPTFNSPLETGIRSVSILVSAYPTPCDLQTLVVFDFLAVHTGDVDGPESLHPRLPFADKEILVRRGIVERGLLLMMSRGLIERIPQDNGIVYQAGEFAETFLNALSAPYLTHLRERTDWVIENYGQMDDDLLRNTMKRLSGGWIEEFQSVQRSLAAQL
jgi:hypothetical protein